MNSLQQLMAFSHTARLGSFAAAARELGCAPSTLAKSVARLESALDVKLFHRTTRQVSLTPDGEHLYCRPCQSADALGANSAAQGAGTAGIAGDPGHDTLHMKPARSKLGQPSQSLATRTAPDVIRTAHSAQRA